MSAQPTFAEFFAGIGLMRLGLERTGWKCVWANDFDSGKQSMYIGCFGNDDQFVLADIGEVRGEDVPSVDLATASFPCTDMSLAGARAGFEGSHSSTFWQFIRVLEEMGERRPRMVLVENVVGFLSTDAGRDLAAALLELNRLGYAVAILLLDAASFVPQSRPRVFIMGSLDAPTRRGAPSVNFRLGSALLAEAQVDWLDFEAPTPPINTITLDSILENVPDEDPRWWPDMLTLERLLQASPLHREEIERRRQRDKIQFATGFRRTRSGVPQTEFRFDGLAGCLRTPKGGSARQIVAATGHGQVRARWMTAREYARLMGAPDYPFDCSEHRAMFGFGDAVCVPVIEWLAENCLDRIAARQRTARDSVLQAAGA